MTTRFQPRPLVLFLFLFCVLLLSTTPRNVYCEQSSEAVSSEETRKKSVPETATDEKLELILKQMQSAYEKMEDYEGDFKQVSETKTFRRKKESTGKIYFQKPDKMRWAYLEPELQDIYLNGKDMIIYRPLRNVVYKQSLGDMLPGTAPAEIFMGAANLKKTFTITRAEPDLQEEGSYCLKMIPEKRGKMSVEQILLWVGDKDYLPKKMDSRDLLGNVTKLYFTKGKINVKLDKGLFEFVPPPDAEIVENAFQQPPRR